MAVYVVFKALGLKIEVRAILDTNTQEFEDYYEEHEENARDDYDPYQRQAYLPPQILTHNVVGSLGGHGISDAVADTAALDEIVEAWSRDLRKVEWVNGPRQSDLDMVHAAVSCSLAAKPD
jgi:hypothetical protein